MQPNEASRASGDGARWTRWIGPLALTFVAATLTAALFAHFALRHRPRALDDLGALPAFTLTDQAGHPFGASGLEGRLWVVDFFFTRCTGVCPMLAERMGSIGRFIEADPRRAARIGLISISVDPDGDTPERLAAWGRDHGVRSARWKLLTGPSKAIEDVVVRGFHTAMGRPEGDPSTGHFDILHGTHFVLLDRRRHLRGFYPGDPAGVDRLEYDLGRLLDEPPPAEPGATTAGAAAARR